MSKEAKQVTQEHQMPSMRDEFELRSIAGRTRGVFSPKELVVRVVEEYVALEVVKAYLVGGPGEMPDSDRFRLLAAIRELHERGIIDLSGPLSYFFGWGKDHTDRVITEAANRLWQADEEDVEDAIKAVEAAKKTS